IFDFETEKEVSLTFPDWQKKIDYFSFIHNGNIIMVSTEYYRAYIFSSKDDISWACKSMIELKYFKKIYITPKGKLIIFNDTIYEITMWDIEELSIKTSILIDWNFVPESIEISDDEELLVVYARNEGNEEINGTRLYVFSTETGMNLSS
ncbi:14818_t:CDS:1, partial [Racocetra persica]